MIGVNWRVSPGLVSVTVLLWASLQAVYGDKTITWTSVHASDVNLSHITRIAVLPLDNDRSGRITNAIGARLQEIGSFEILERSQLDNLVSEHQLSVSGMVDESSTSEIGQVLGVEVLVYGSVSVFRVYDEATTRRVEWRENETYYKNGKKKTRSVTREALAHATLRRGTIDFIVKLVDVESGRIIAQRAFSDTREFLKIDHLRAKKKNRKELPSREMIEGELVSGAAVAVARYVSPYQLTVEETIDENCKNDNCKQAIQLMGMGMLADAREVLEAQLQKYLSSTKAREKAKNKDKKLAAVLYNLGLIAEAQDERLIAVDFYSQAILARIKDPAKKQLRGRERVTTFIEKWETYEALAKE
jgi:hypothetical protein